MDLIIQKMILNIHLDKRIWTSSCIVFSIAAIIIDLPTTNAYKSYQMNEECGKTIALEENGGELHLDSSKLSRNKLHNGKCRVYIETPWPYQTVMFYFTEFSVGVSNTRTNVTIRGQNRVHLPVIFIDLRTTNAYQSYDMNKECSNTIAVKENGGELHLDSSKMSRSRIPSGKCTVYIKPPWRYQDVMFYFTEFSVGMSDTKTNVSIRGVSSPIPELPNDLYGNMKSFINPVRLFEVEDSMSVTYTTSFTGRDISTFTMKFIYLSDCKVKDLSHCHNGRCVSKGVKCNKTLYACGTGPNECLENPELESVGKSIVYGFIAVILLVVVCSVCICVPLIGGWCD